MFGVVAYGVRQRAREIGIRVALGAKPAGVLRMVLCEGLRLAFGGIAIGTLSAFALTRFVQGLLFGVTPHDPVAFIAAPLVLTAVALVAVWLPARRMAWLDPIAVLRSN